MNTQNIVDLLNEMLAIDPKATSSLWQLRVPTNEAVANHKTIMVRGDPPTLGILGILNGIAAIDNYTIYATYENDKLIDRFVAVPNFDDTECGLPDVAKGNIHTISSLSQFIGYQLKSFNIPNVWKDTEGEDVVVAVLDTGCQTNHVDLKSSFINNGQSLQDNNGHGTHVAGIISANNNTLGIVGVAPKAKIFVSKVLDGNGRGSAQGVAHGIHDAINAGVDIINMSLGANVSMPVVHEAIKRAYAEDIAVICAAGNSGDTGELSYPARYPETISIGALTKNKLRAEFSQTGNKLDFMAPGVAILSTIPNNKYQNMSGTSMASPWAAGVAALIISKHKKYGGNTPVKTVEQLREHMKRTAIDLESIGRDTKTGFGLVDVEKAIEFGIDKQPEIIVSAIQSESIDGPINDEWVEFKNIGDKEIDLTDHIMSDIAGWEYTFPDGFKLDVDASVKVHINNGADSASDLYWGYNRAILNNNGDTIWIKDKDNNIIVEFSY